jgi:hypothetical protein
MRKASFTLAAGFALAFSMCMGGSVSADEAAGAAKARTTGSTKPNLGNGPAVEKSLPSSAPQATTTRTTGTSNQDKTVKTMNSNEKAKVEATGK